MKALDADAAKYSSPAARHALYRRSLLVVLISQAFGGAGLAAGVTVGALLAKDMLGGEAVSGLPAALFTGGSALAAISVGHLTQRFGRRMGLAAGFMAGAAGAAGVVLAAVLSNPILLFAALFVYGSGTATNLQARYAGTDLAPANRRATAVSFALVATTLGAVIGPNSVSALGRLALGIGIPPLAGPFLLAAVAYALAAIVMHLLLRPDPYFVARALASADLGASRIEGGQTRSTALVQADRRGIAVGATIMVVTQISMVAIMTMTPVHMRGHHHSLTQVGFVISVHIAAMFLPSLVTGALVDRFGRVRMAVFSGATLLGAGVVAATVPGNSLLWLSVALGLLGLGWNLGLISGTALIVDSTALDSRAKTQGSIDVLVALGGATGAAMSGVVVSSASYAVLSLVSGFLSLLLIPAVLRLPSGARRRVGTAEL